MALLHHGVDLSVIALWLGHESTETTEIYLHADMQLKERASRMPHRLVLSRIASASRPLLAFLESFDYAASLAGRSEIHLYRRPASAPTRHNPERGITPPIPLAA